MKIYLLIVALLFIQTLSYRYSGTQALELSASPQTISFLAPNILVVKNGKTIYVYNTASNFIQQSFQSDSNDPQPQVAEQLNMVIFKYNNTLFQMQPSDGPVTVNEPEAGDQWVYPLGLANDTIVYHSLDPAKTNRWLTFVQYKGPYQYETQAYLIESPAQFIERGSGVQAVTPNDYYFISGGVCDAQTQVLYFFRGSQDGANNVFNLSIPGCNMPRPQLKQTIALSSVDLGNEDRIHAVSYKLDVDANPFMHTTQVIYQINGFFQEWVRFDTFKLIGIDYIGSNLYTADEELCRVLQHQPDAYKKSEKYTSVLPNTVTDTATSAQNYQIAVFNGGSDFQIFKFSDGTGKIQQQLYKNPASAATFTNGDYYGGDLWIVRDSTTTSLSTVYLPADPTAAAIKDMGYQVVDYCSTKSQVLFTVQRNGLSYTLNQDTITFIGDPSTRVIRTEFSIPLPAAVQSIECLDATTVLVFPGNDGDPITTWQSDGSSFTQMGTLTKDKNIHSQVHVTATAIVFINSNYQSMLAYDFRLSLISDTLQPLLPPEASYRIVTTYGNNIVFSIAARGEITQPDSLDHYSLLGSSLTYVGSYPLYGTSPVDFNKVILLGSISRLSIDYGTTTICFEVTYPPQSLRGYFYDALEQDCRGYNYALFKLNPLPDTYDMIIVNSINTYPVLERYTFNDKTLSLLPKKSTVTLTNFLYSQMQVQLSSDRLKILIYGIKQTAATNLVTVQVKNAVNLDTLFEKEFFDITVKDKVQAFGLYNSQFISAVTYQTTVIGGTNVSYALNLNVDVGSKGKISTDSSIASIDLFAVCARCSFTAVATYNSRLIQLLSLTNGINRANITVSCTLKQLALSSDGNRIGYLCQNNGLYVYDNTIDQSYFLAGNYTQITYFYFLTNQIMIIINNGVVSQVKIGYSQTSKLMDNSKVIRQSLTSIPVKTVAINYNLQIYAYISDPQTVSILNQQGGSAGVFQFNDPTQNIIGIAFDPLNQLIVTTDANNLITLSPTDCPANTTINDATSYCVCNPTFSFINDTCLCSSPLYLDVDSCICEDGNYYVSATQCAECNVMCHRCTGDGVSNCTSYSALFIIIIVFSVLIVAGLFVFCYIKSKKTETKLQSAHRSASNKKKSQSSDALAERLINKEGEEKMKLQI